MPVPNMRSKLIEKILYITPDGVTYNLSARGYKEAVEIVGWGLVDPNLHATTGPYQDGSTINAIRTPSRSVSLKHYVFGNTKDSYWANRRALVDALRPSRTDENAPQPGYLKRYLSDGTIRQLDVFVVRGPVFDDTAGYGDGTDIAETIDFLATDPFPYDPTQETNSLSGWACTPVGALIFPAVFPITFGTLNCSVTQNFVITYTGKQKTFPTIIITGPANDPVIVNTASGFRLALDYNIAAGEVVTFDLTYGAKTVTNNSGTSLLGNLSTDSDLGVFSILPDPLAAGGVNTLTVTFENGTAATNIQVNYYIRDAGI